MDSKCFLILASCLVHVFAYPTGAPAGACGTLNPDSHGPSTATGPSPYTITFSSSTYQPGQVVKVTLGGAQFKGFLIVGRAAAGTSTDIVGHFINPPMEASLQCIDSKTGNGVTHNNNTVKSELTFDWRAPAPAVGDVVFHYTVVRGGAPSVKVDPADYFMDVKSAPLKADSGPLLYENELTQEIVLEVIDTEQEEEERVPIFEKVVLRRPRN